MIVAGMEPGLPACWAGSTTELRVGQSNAKTMNRKKNEGGSGGGLVSNFPSMSWKMTGFNKTN